MVSIKPLSVSRKRHISRAWGAGSTRLFFSGGEMWECGVGSRGALQTLAAYRVGANLAELER